MISVLNFNRLSFFNITFIIMSLYIFLSCLSTFTSDRLIYNSNMILSRFVYLFLRWYLSLIIFISFLIINLADLVVSLSLDQLMALMYFIYNFCTMNNSCLNSILYSITLLIFLYFAVWILINFTFNTFFIELNLYSVVEVVVWFR